MVGAIGLQKTSCDKDKYFLHASPPEVDAASRFQVDREAIILRQSHRSFKPVLSIQIAAIGPA